MGPPPPQRPPPVLAVKTPEELEHWVQERPKTLLVIDVHPEWCGPCSDVLEGFYRKTVLEANNNSTDNDKGATTKPGSNATNSSSEKEGGGGGGGSNAEEEGGSGGGTAGPALQFLSASRPLVGAKLRALLFPTADAQKEAQQQTQMTCASGKHAPPASTAAAPLPSYALDDGSGSGSGGGGAAVAALLESGGCQPLFVFIKGRQLVGVVRGVDTPAQLQLVQQHVGGGGGGSGGGTGMVGAA